MSARTKNATHDGDEDRCPNCGYCHHCGQSTKSPQIIKEVIREPRRPYSNAPWVEGVPYKVWCGTSVGTTTERARYEHISISPSAGNEC